MKNCGAAFLRPCFKIFLFLSQQISALVKNIIIAVDGHSSCGKSTLARDLAAALRYTYIDSGAMYRAVTLYFMQQSIDLQDEAAVGAALEEIDIRFAPGTNHTLLNGRDVEHAIRDRSVSGFVSQVAAVSAVRSALVRQQQRMGSGKALVMDGRDIGTVVFPAAELKIFLTAELEVRVQRRYAELCAKGMEATRAAVRENLLMRDHIDSTREDSPLRQADDAVVIDNSRLSRAEQLQKALELAEQARGA